MSRLMVAALFLCCGLSFADTSQSEIAGLKLDDDSRTALVELGAFLTDQFSLDGMGLGYTQYNYSLDSDTELNVGVTPNHRIMFVSYRQWPLLPEVAEDLALAVCFKYAPGESCDYTELNGSGTNFELAYESEGQELSAAIRTPPGWEGRRELLIELWDSSEFQKMWDLEANQKAKHQQSQRISEQEAAHGKLNPKF